MERLHMNHIRDLLHRLRAGESERRITRDMGVSRQTVRKYHELAKHEGYLEKDSPLPDDKTLEKALGTPPQPPRNISSIEPFGETVKELRKKGVEMVAILQRLQADHGYTGSYSSVRRYVHRIEGEKAPQAYTRVHSAPGEEMQVDFGSVGQLFDPASGKIRTAYVFVATLSYSRHQYAELVFDQKTVSWIGLHRRAFEAFGGIPQRVVPDNLKAAVIRALVHDPVLGEAYRKMALHYNFLISPTRPYTPRHKGKVENGVHYVQRNFIAGQTFADIHAANRHLKDWVANIAGTRDHGTTHQAPLALFREVEQAALQPLPAEAFSLCEIRSAKVHPDCHLVVNGSYYSAPYTYVGKKLDVYIHEQIVELYDGQTLLATHLRCTERGQWQTRMEHYPEQKAAFLMKTPDYCRQTAERIGPATSKVVVHLLAERPLYQLRAVQAILRLEESVGAKRLEAACARAAYYGDLRYRRIKDILNAALDRDPLPEAEIQPIATHHAFARPASDFFSGAQL